MKKIMFVIPSLREGGAERVITRLSAGIAELGYDVHILEFFRPGSGYEIDPNVHLLSIFQNEEAYNSVSFFKKNALMRKAITTVEPDVIIPFLEYVCQKTQLALLGTKYFNKVVVTLRVTPTIGNLAHKIRRFLSILFSRACIAQTESQKRFLNGILQKKTYVIANPVDQIDIPFSEPPGQITFISAGRLVPQKNYPMMIKAFAQVAQERDVYLQIYGAGKMEGELKRIIENLGISSRALLMGYSNNIIDDYRKANIFLLTSNWEGMPNSLMEAMALGMPCIATDCPTGPAELIKNEENGLLIPINNEKSLVCAMLKLVDCTSLRSSYGQAARSSIMSEYSRSAISERWVNILKEIKLL